MRILGAEILECAPQVPKSEPWKHLQPKNATRYALSQSHSVRYEINSGDELGAFVEEILTRLRQNDSPGGTMEQRRLDKTLELLDAAGYDGWGNAELASRAAKTLCFGDADKSLNAEESIQSALI